MSVLGQPLGEEHLVASPDHTTVVQVNIVDKEPCADAVVSQLAAFLCQLHDVFVEEQPHLVF